MYFDDFRWVFASIRGKNRGIRKYGCIGLIGDRRTRCGLGDQSVRYGLEGIELVVFVAEN